MIFPLLPHLFTFVSWFFCYFSVSSQLSTSSSSGVSFNLCASCSHRCVLLLCCCCCFPLSILLSVFHEPLSCVYKNNKTFGTKQSQIPLEVKKIIQLTIQLVALLLFQTKGVHILYFYLQNLRKSFQLLNLHFSPEQSTVPIPAAHDRNPSISQLECTVHGG